MFQTLKNAWKTKDIRSKIIFTLFILLLYRIGTVIPVPFVEANTFAGSFSGTILDYMNTLSGGSLGTATLFALGVSPYINASIIIQLLAVVFPKLGELAKDDKEKMNFITRIVTVILAIVTAIGYYFLLKNNGARTNAATATDNSLYWFYGIVIVACYCAGASIIMWLAERINERGIGNGISIILFANIISSMPSLIINLVELVISTYQYSENAWLYGIVSTVFALALIAVIIALTVFVIFITGSERRIPIQYSQRTVGRKMYGGQSTHLPLKVNMTGVMPIIFASSIVSLLPTILALCGITETSEGFWGGVSRVFSASGAVYPILLFVLIIAFAYFYTQITFNPVEVAKNLQDNGGVIRGISPGKPTADHIRKRLNKVTFVGALFLGLIAVLPVLAGPHLIQHLIEWLMSGSDMAKEIEKYLADSSMSWYGSYMQSQMDSTVSALTSTFTFGGTTLLIVVGVALETFRELEAQLTVRNYKNYLK
ncbi:MAG: preprotein translocase subunit SecY [Clostridia bacterium]|nr:preprotein translocase subunit SecY [Clostridia bacterium]